MPKRLLKKSWLIKSIFFISAFLILLIGGITYRNIEDLNKSSHELTKTYHLNYELELIFSHLKDAETGQRGFIISNDPSFLEPYEIGRENINNSFAELKELAKNNSSLQDSLKTLNLLINTRMQSFEKSFRFSSVGNYNDPNFKESFLFGKKLMDTIRTKITNIINHENQLLSEKQKAYESNLKVTPIFLYSVLLVALSLMFLAYTKIISDLKKLKAYNERLEIFKQSTKQSEIISQHGNWVFNIDENTFTYSDNLYRLLGEKPQSFPPTLENYLSFVHPDDIEKLQSELDKMIKDENLPFIYYRIVQK